MKKGILKSGPCSFLSLDQFKDSIFKWTLVQNRACTDPFCITNKYLTRGEPINRYKPILICTNEQWQNLETTEHISYCLTLQQKRKSGSK